MKAKRQSGLRPWRNPLGPPAATRRYAYPFTVSQVPGGLIEIDASPMWSVLLRDLWERAPASTMALRFHEGLSKALVETTIRLARRGAIGPQFHTVALSGGCFQNRILFESVARELRAAGFAVLAHADVPANDGGLSLGQAAVGAARLLKARANRTQGTGSCVSAFQAASSD